MKAERLAQLIDIAGPVSRETCVHLEAFEQQFRKWAARINLIASSTLDDLWSRHILDSAQLNRLAPQAARWLDLGSGGGFPGLVIGFLLAERAGTLIDLVESNHRKAGFLQAMVGQFSLPAHVHAKRINEMHGVVAQPDVVTARALAPLPDLLKLTEPWLSAGAMGLFHKGRDYRDELQESAASWHFDLIEHRSRVDPQGMILQIENLRRGTRPSRQASDK